jgi:hypothetical protein
VAAVQREVGVKKVIAIFALVAAPVFADEVYLRGGGQISGEIVSQTEDTVTIDIGGGTLSAQMASVVRIEKSVSPLQEYRAKAADLAADDAEAWRELARWAQGEALSSQAAEAYSRVLRILPDDDEANRALGRVWFDGRWATEEGSYAARGYVEFEGQWMTPQERQSILASRQTREEANRQAIDAEVQAIEAEQRAERERKDAEREAAMRGNLPQLGDPVIWGWGPGPGYWPAPRQGQ